jgi:hypothetical protein
MGVFSSQGGGWGLGTVGKKDTAQQSSAQHNNKKILSHLLAGIFSFWLHILLPLYQMGI